jgi:uncharacterized protein DUF2378
MEARTKGYAFIAAVKFAESEFAPEARDRVLSKLSTELRVKLPAFKHDGWYPRADLVTLLRAIADEYSGPSATYAALCKLGSAMAHEMSNVFIRLVIRILNPSLLAKKLPQLFALDNRGGSGRLEVDAARLGERHLRLTFKDMRGYDYYAPVCEGWIRFFLESMGVKNIRCTPDPWSPEAPGPEEFGLDVRWS